MPTSIFLSITNIFLSFTFTLSPSLFLLYFSLTLSHFLLLLLTLCLYVLPISFLFYPYLCFLLSFITLFSNLSFFFFDVKIVTSVNNLCVCVWVDGFMNGTSLSRFLFYIESFKIGKLLKLGGNS